jgi:hypothetical protein
VLFFTSENKVWTVKGEAWQNSSERWLKLSIVNDQEWQVQLNFLGLVVSYSLYQKKKKKRVILAFQKINNF